MENVLVVGASGTTGNKIVQLLKSSQYFEPIAMVRNAQQQAEFLSQNIKTVLGDLEQDVAHTTQDVAHTTKNADKVIFAAGSGGKKVKAVDQEGAKKMIRASEQANVKKFIMLSSMGADNPQQSETIQEYLKAKHQADEFLKDSNLNHVIVRPGALNNDKGQGKIQLAKLLSKQGEISRDDVAQTLVRALHDDAVNNKTFEILQGDMLIGKALSAIE